MAKFHQKAVAIFGIKQNSEARSAILFPSTATSELANNRTSGTITVALNGTAVTGVGTKFDYGTTPGDKLGDLTVGGYIYNSSGAIVGRVASITNQTAAVLEAPGALVAVSGAAYATGLGPKNALAILNLNFSTEIEKETYQYAGDELDRDEETVITDKYAKFDFETFIPSLGANLVSTIPSGSQIPYSDWFQAAGFSPVTDTGKITYTNSVASNNYMSVEIRRSSPDIPNDQKTFILSSVRGNIDLDVNVGTKGKLKWNFQGNLDRVVDKTKIATTASDFGTQKSNKAPSITSSSLITSQLGVYSGATEPTFSSGTKTVCFQKLTAPNVTGFTYERYQTGCVDGWSKGAEATDVTLTILEDRASATYNPDNNVELSHALFLEYGAAAGSKVKFAFHKLFLGGVANSTVAAYTGQDLQFRNVGYTDIELF